MNTRSFRTVPLFTALLIAAAGCASASAGSTTLTSAGPRPEEPDITVAALPAVDLAGLYVAQDEGLFAQQGLHVTLEKIASSQAIIADQLKGQVDLSAGSYLPYIAAQAAGAKFRILAEASTLRPDERVLATTADSPITTVGQLAGQKIGVNGTDSIGTLLISALLSEQGVSPRRVRFVTDPAGFPAMPAALAAGAWGAAFLAEPYVTVAGEEYGERILADLDQGSNLNFPIDGYVATTAWAQANPNTAAAFVRAIEAGQLTAASDPAAVRAAMARYDQVPPEVTSAMALSGYPTGPVASNSIQPVAAAMLQFGLLSPRYAAEVRHGTLVASMIT